MNGPTPTATQAPRAGVEGIGQGDFAVARAQEMYRRVVTGWAHDALRLRASGLDRPTRRIGRPGAVRPTSTVPGRAA